LYIFIQHFFIAQHGLSPKLQRTHPHHRCRGIHWPGTRQCSTILKPSIHLTLADVFEPPSPNTSRTTAVKADLTTSAAVDSLLSSQQWKACYLLHGIMSGGAEANLDLGLAVNIDPPSHTRLSTKAPTWCRRGLPFFTKSLRPTRVAGTAVR